MAKKENKNDEVLDPNYPLPPDNSTKKQVFKFMDKGCNYKSDMLINGKMYIVECINGIIETEEIVLAEMLRKFKKQEVQ